MADKTIDDRIDDATHAALAALGLSADTDVDVATAINDALWQHAEPALRVREGTVDLFNLSP